MQKKRFGLFVILEAWKCGAGVWWGFLLPDNLLSGLVWVRNASSGDLLINHCCTLGPLKSHPSFPSKGLTYKHRWYSTLVMKFHTSFGGGTNTQTTASLLSFCLFYSVCHLDFASQKTIWKSVTWNPNHFLLHLWFFRLTISIGFIWAVVRWI